MAFFRSLVCTLVLTAFVFAPGCAGSLSHLSRPGNPEDYPKYRHATVALVEFTSGGNMVGPTCTAFFISPRQLATAEHCVVDRGQVVELGRGRGIRVRPENPEETVGREILFISYEAEEEFLALKNRPGSGPEYHRTTVVAIDEENDVAVLELVENEDDWTFWFETRNFEQEPVLPGERVYAISNPVGNSFMLGEGIISRILLVGTELRIYHQVRVGHGSSGSPLIDRNGKIIGVNVAISAENILTVTIPMIYVQTQLRILETQREIQRLDEQVENNESEVPEELS